MRACFSFLLLMALCLLPMGCGGSEQGTDPEPDVSTPEAAAEALPPPGEEATP